MNILVSRTETAACKMLLYNTRGPNQQVTLLQGKLETHMKEGTETTGLLFSQCWAFPLLSDSSIHADSSIHDVDAK
jgi:hypothetical protein